MLLSRKEISGECRKLKATGKKIVFTNGCFDIIHAGHVIYLTEAKKLGDILIIGLNSDDSVRRLKGKSRPVNNQTDRAAILSALKSVDFVTVFDEDTPFKLIRLLKPDILVKGGDYRAEDIVGYDVVLKNGGKVVVVPFVEGHSTSNVISRLSSKI